MYVCMYVGEKCMYVCMWKCTCVWFPTYFFPPTFSHICIHTYLLHTFPTYKCMYVTLSTYICMYVAHTTFFSKMYVCIDMRHIQKSMDLFTRLVATPCMNADREPRSFGGLTNLHLCRQRCEFQPYQRLRSTLFAYQPSGSGNQNAMKLSCQPAAHDGTSIGIGKGDKRNLQLV